MGQVFEVEKNPVKAAQPHHSGELPKGVRAAPSQQLMDQRCSVSPGGKVARRLVNR